MQLVAYVQSLRQAGRAGAAARAPARRRQPGAGAPRRRSRDDRRHDRALNRPAARPNYLNADYGVKSWLLTTDHKRIALLYLVSDHADVLHRRAVRGGHPPGADHARRATSCSRRPTTSSSPCTASIMVFFFLIPSIPAVLGNFLIPIMIGAKDLAFPRLTWPAGTSTWSAACFTLWAHGRTAGWTPAGPSTRPTAPPSPTRTCWPRASGIFITGFSSILTGLNFIVTIHKMRAPGLTWFRLPLFVWAHYATSLIMVLGTPVIAVTMLMVAVERTLPPGLLRPRAGRRPGALPAPVLVLLAPRGLHHDPARHGRDQRARHLLLAQAHLRLRVHRHLQPGHRGGRLPGLGPPHVRVRPVHLRGHGLLGSSASWWPSPPPSRSSTGRPPSTRARSRCRRPMLYAMGFIGLFTIGGLTGLFLAALGLDVHVHDTYFVVAHFHYIMVGGAIMGYLGGLHFWWPKITGRLYPEMLGAGGGRDRLRRLQPHLLPAVRPGLPGHAAALPRLPGGVPGPERDVVRGRLHPGRGLPAARWSTSSGRCATAAAASPTPGGPRAWSGRRPRRRPPRTSTTPAGGERRGLRLRRRGAGGGRCLTPTPRRTIPRWPTTSRTWSSRRKPPPWDVGVHRPGGDVLRRPVPGLHRLPRPLPGGLRRGQPPPGLEAGRLQHGRAHRQQPDHGPGRARGRPGPAPADRGWLSSPSCWARSSWA